MKNPTYQAKINVAEIARSKVKTGIEINYAKIENQILNYIGAHSYPIPESCKETRSPYDYGVCNSYEEDFLTQEDIFLRFKKIEDFIEDFNEPINNIYIELSSFQTPVDELRENLEGIIKTNLNEK